MRAALLVALVACSASAQVFPQGGTSGSGGTPDPGRDDVAASYNATGPNGFRATPQATVGSLGACAALSGAFAVATPAGESEPRPYFCDGSQWRRVYTSADGTLPNADVVVPGYTFASQAPSGAYAFRASNNGARVDFGGGAGDYIYSDGIQLFSASSFQLAAGQALTSNIIAPTSGGILGLYPSSWVLLGGTAALATCDAGAAGGIQHLTTDHRLYYCDGSTALRLTRSLISSAAIDPANLAAGDCTTLTGTVTGAATTDVDVRVVPSAAILSGLIMGNQRVSAADTVSFDLCNVTLLTALNQPSTTFNFTVSR